MAPLDGDPAPPAVPRTGAGGLAGRAHALPVRRSVYVATQRVRVGRRLLSAMQPGLVAGAHRDPGADRAHDGRPIHPARALPPGGPTARPRPRAGAARGPPGL